MNRTSSTRREFLTKSSAVLSIGLLGEMSLSQRAFANSSEAGAKQAVACSRREAGEAAAAVLRQGGNAVDAAAAALVVQCVIEPYYVGLGGYASSFVLYDAKTGRVRAIDADSRAPRKFDPATFNEAAGMHGYLAVGVPGVIAGIDSALRQFGTMPFKTLAQPALALAENGTRVTPRLANAFDSLQQSIDPVSHRAFFPDGVPAKDATWRQADLARMIRRLGDEGLASFYTGDMAATIARQVQAGGGALAEEDFHDFHATLVEPLHITYRGFDLYTPPLPSGGLTSLSILKTLEQFDLSKLEPWGAKYIELFAGASNLCWAERFKFIGDPEFVDVPVEDLLSDKRAAQRAEIMRRGAPTAPALPAEPAHTVNIAVVDKDCNVVSWTATHGGEFGSHVAIEGLGLMLGHGMSRFAYTSLDPNYPAGGKRPQHNMSPLVVLQDGKPYAALGMPGGRMIVTVTAQLAANLIDFKADPKRIVTAPRIHAEGQEPIQVTADTPAAVVDELRKMGHAVEVKPALGGLANAIVIDSKTSAVRAAASGGSTGVVVF
jgi:gamma-glutamyltranspeptidase / glutathione hydrolase